MADERLRDDERRTQGLGAPDERARLLASRLRAGSLSVEAVEAAAALGDADARSALGLGPAPEVHPWHAEVQRALARRALEGGARPIPEPKVVTLTTSHRPSPRALQASLGHGPLWELRAERGDGTTLLIRASRGPGAFPNLCSLWLDVGLPRVSGLEGRDPLALAGAHLARWAGATPERAAFDGVTVDEYALDDLVPWSARQARGWLLVDDPRRRTIVGQTTALLFVLHRESSG
jgi:hypothetical protein